MGRPSSSSHRHTISPSERLVPPELLRLSLIPPAPPRAHSSTGPSLCEPWKQRYPFPYSRPQTHDLPLSSADRRPIRVRGTLEFCADVKRKPSEMPKTLRLDSEWQDRASAAGLRGRVHGGVRRQRPAPDCQRTTELSSSEVSELMTPLMSRIRRSTASNSCSDPQEISATRSHPPLVVCKAVISGKPRNPAIT